jgi:hypothetical protein
MRTKTAGSAQPRTRREADSVTGSLIGEKAVIRTHRALRDFVVAAGAGSSALPRFNPWRLAMGHLAERLWRLVAVGVDDRAGVRVEPLRRRQRARNTFANSGDLLDDILTPTLWRGVNRAMLDVGRLDRQQGTSAAYVGFIVPAFGRATLGAWLALFVPALLLRHCRGLRQSSRRWLVRPSPRPANAQESVNVGTAMTT